MDFSMKKETPTTSQDEQVALALDQVDIMMAMPKKIRAEWLAAGFSETAAETAALAQWVGMVTQGRG